MMASIQAAVTCVVSLVEDRIKAAVTNIVTELNEMLKFRIVDSRN